MTTALPGKAVRIILLSSSALLSALGVAGAAMAADSGPTQVEEVIVTSQRRAEKLQAVPVSVQVVQAVAIQQNAYQSLNALVQTIPSVHISGVGGGGRANELFIRGIGSGNNQSFDQSVGMFIDDVYHGRSRVSGGAFLDVDRVEVLKGPQSTFFGNNAIAGAFNIVSTKPGATFEGYARALYGQDGQYAVETAMGGPLSDTFGVRVAATASGMQGWLTNVNTGGHEPNIRNVAARITGRWAPTNDFDATLKVEVGQVLNKGFWGVQVVDCPPPAPFVAAGFCNTRLGLHLPEGTGNNQNSESRGTGSKMDTTDAALTMNKRLGDNTLTSVTGFYGYHYTANVDGDFTPLTLLPLYVPESYSQFSQELRLTSPEHQTIEWMTGIYYQTDHLHFTQDFDYAFLSPTIQSKAPFAALVPYLPLGQETDYTQKETSWAVFGSATWNITDQLKLSGGLRASQVDKSRDWDLFYGTTTQSLGYGKIVPFPAAVAPLAPLLGLGTPGAISGSRRDQALLPSAKLQYQVTPDVMLYASYAKGFKAGGFNGTDTTGVVVGGKFTAPNQPFAPEKVDSYEIGMKSELLNHRVVFNLAAFLGNYKDLQLTTNLNSTGAITTLVTNAAQVRSQGVELDTTWLVTSNFKISADGTYLDSHYLKYPNASLTALQTFCRATYVTAYCSNFANPVPSVQNLAGRPTEYAPRWSGSLRGSYAFELPNDFRLTTEAAAIYSSLYYLTNTDDPLLAQKAYTRIDARISLEGPSRRWSVDLIGKNLTNQVIWTFANGVPTALASNYVQKEEPSAVALQVRYKW